MFFKAQTSTNGDPEWATWVKAAKFPATPAAQQVWGKPLPGGAWAIIAINANVNQSMSVSLPLSMLNLSGPVTATDIWAGGKPAPGGAVAEKFEPPAVGPRDSGFYKLSPALKADDTAADNAATSAQAGAKGTSFAERFGSRTAAIDGTREAASC